MWVQAAFLSLLILGLTILFAWSVRRAAIDIGVEIGREVKQGGESSHVGENKRDNR